MPFHFLLLAAEGWVEGWGVGVELKVKSSAALFANEILMMKMFLAIKQLMTCRTGLSRAGETWIPAVRQSNHTNNELTR